MTFELLIKPTYRNQYKALPRRDAELVESKIDLLIENPRPDSKNKKRVVSYKQPVFRIRAGDYRVLYMFDEQAGWVSLLSVDSRADVYEQGELVDTTKPTFDFSALLSDEEALEPRPVVTPHFPKPAPPAPVETPLETPIDAALLDRLGIDARFRPALLACTTLEALLVAEVPDAVREQVFDVITAPNIEQVIDQPSFVVPDVDDLIRYQKGELIDFLLKLDPDQERYVSRAITSGGPVLIKGGPGTGKSTIAIYRVRAVLNALRKQGVAEPRILFTTYTNALISSTRQLLEQLLGTEASTITVETADKLARTYVNRIDGPPNILKDYELREPATRAIKTFKQRESPLLGGVLDGLCRRLTLSYLIEEIETVIVARNIQSAEAYQQLPRVGRRVPLQRLQRSAIWRLHQIVSEQLEQQRATTWARMRQRAAELVTSRSIRDRYDAVFIDEAQDLQPNLLRMLVALCRTPDRLLLTADANQSIYGSGFNWSDVHGDLRFKGRTGLLRKNYRSTREIGDAAAAYLQDAGLDPEKTTNAHVTSGPTPAARFVRPEDERNLLITYFRQATRDFRLGYGACAVLVPTEETGRWFEKQLRGAGLDACFMPSRSLDLRSPAIKIITHKSAKGLEFPIVALAGLSALYPPSAADEQERLERELIERRALYVAMTRAMRTLLVLAPKQPASNSNLFTGFHEPLWNLGSNPA